MQSATAYFVLLGPLLVLIVDLAINLVDGQDATISGVIRRWHGASSWPEFVFVVGVVVMYLHFFHNWPER